MNFNRMLERLESGFDNQRRFVHDASHELRTPMTIIRGYLELLRSGDPDDVDQTRSCSWTSLTGCRYWWMTCCSLPAAAGPTS